MYEKELREMGNDKLLLWSSIVTCELAIVTHAKEICDLVGKGPSRLNDIKAELLGLDATMGKTFELLREYGGKP